MFTGEAYELLRLENQQIRPFFAALDHSLNVDLMVKIGFCGQKRFCDILCGKRSNPNRFAVLPAVQQ